MVRWWLAISTAAIDPNAELYTSVWTDFTRARRGPRGSPTLPLRKFAQSKLAVRRPCC